MFRKVLIANRGAIACRIERTLRRMGIGSVAVYSEADATARHVLEADEAVGIGPAAASESYLNTEQILAAARQTGAEAIHPGYGFLSENQDFVAACAAAGIRFIGPSAAQMEAFARKHTAREIASRCGVPLLQGTGVLASCHEALAAADGIGYPVMLKSSAGGGGIGMRVCANRTELEAAYASVVRLSENSFGDGSVFLEKFVARARHVEVQIFGDGEQVVALGARDCSAQRRHQKVLEETPPPGLSQPTLEGLMAAAVKLGNAVGYQSAGTVEFLVDAESEAFFFLEVNTRLQVEHGVTEEVTGIDLVEWMVLEAAGELRLSTAMPTEMPGGCSIQARLYAEDPADGFRPAPGRLSSVQFPEWARVESWVEAGCEVTPYYDPMLAKVIVTGKDRSEAVARLESALAATTIEGTETNLRYLRQVTASESFQTGTMTTSFLAGFHYHRRALVVLEGGTQTTIQDAPGRVGYWPVGVPPSGPMDALAMRMANRLVGNAEGTPALEMTSIGATVRLDGDLLLALTGAEMEATLDGVPVPRWKVFPAHSGQVLRLGAARQGGARAYLAVRGGWEGTEFLGSRSTFLLGGFGGHAGRALRAGDVVHVGAAAEMPAQEYGAVPEYGKHWTIGVLYGPHAAPEFFTDADIAMIFATDWKVHYQSDRTGVRLIGPRPEWARSDGGEAGLHPSNLHDNAYAIGSIDFTGDMPILLGPDGPSLGGFVCPGVVVAAELWKLGQLKAGDSVRFLRLSLAQAARLEGEVEAYISGRIQDLPQLPKLPDSNEPAVLSQKHVSGRAPGTGLASNPGMDRVCRAAGDKYLLVEYGERVLDLELRFRVHLLEEALRAEQVPGIVEMTPGVRSLQIHYDSAQLNRERLLEIVENLDQQLPEQASDVAASTTVASRIVSLPLSWDDPATRLAQAKYMQSVRPDAPWCPDNIEFIRRINGLSDITDVHRVVYEAEYLVLGLGDVYLGAPVATPLDPRHRLVTTKYNPARTWTPENAVGIGGAYLCVYGMEGPGGYQLVGRTVPVWNTYRSTRTFAAGRPWALRNFDQIRFFPVTASELLEMRRDLLHGKYELKIEEHEFNLKSYKDFLESIQGSTVEFRRRQRAAFDEERERWRAMGVAELPAVVDDVEASESTPETPPGMKTVDAPMTASVFQVAVTVGQRVAAGERVVVLDAMKTEIVIAAAASGVVREIRCTAGKLVHAGQSLVVMEAE